MKTSSPADRSLEHPIIWVAVIGGALGSILLLKAVAWLAFPLILAIVLYYLVQPLLQKLQLAGVTPGQALGIFLGAATVLTVIFSILVLPKMLNFLSEFQNQIPTYWERLQSVLRENLLTLEDRFAFAKKARLADGMEDQLNVFLAGSGKEYVADVALFLLHWLPSLMLVPFLTFFFLRDGTAFHRLVLRAVPNAFFEKTLLLFDRMDAQMRAYFRVDVGCGISFFGSAFAGRIYLHANDRGSGFTYASPGYRDDDFFRRNAGWGLRVAFSYASFGDFYRSGSNVCRDLV